MTRDLLAMADWMAEQGVTHVAMESTGVFWKPIYNILEGRFTMLLVNARHPSKYRGGRAMCGTASGSHNCCSTGC
jgi:hypothetical protein